MNKEIEQLKQERENVKKQKGEQDKLIKKLNKDTEDFEKQKEKAMADIEEIKAEEIKKLKKEKRAFERQMKAMQNVPNRKEREETELLKKEVVQLKEELKNKDSRYKLNMDRAKKQIEDLTTHNTELENEVRILEELRLNFWKSSGDRKKTKENFNPATQKKVSKGSNYVQEGLASREAKHKVALAEPKVLKDATNYSKHGGVLGEERPVTTSAFLPAPLLVKKEQSFDSAAKPSNKQRTPSKEGDEDTYDLHLPERYHGQVPKKLSESTHSDGKITRVYENGKTEVVLSNKSRRESFPDGYTVTFFANADIKQVFPDGKMVYYSAGTKTTQTTYSDGVQVFKFENGQVEKRYTDGAREIMYPDGTVKCVFPDGEEEVIYADGTVEKVDRLGNRTRNFGTTEVDVKNEA